MISAYHNNHLLRFLQICAILSFSYAADFYKLLGISRKATHKEIKKAYREKARINHPDKNKAEGAAEKFAEIARAYEVLSDESKREIYDERGEDGLKKHEDMSGGGGGGDPFDDIFSHFGFGGQNRKEQGVQRTDSIEIPLTLTLKELYEGKVMEVEYVRETLCTNWEECVKKDQECAGPGVKTRMQQIGPGFVQKIQMEDPRCISRGKSWRSNCKACPKGKTQTEKISLTIDVVKGMRNGEQISFEGVTDEKPGFEAGDLNFAIKEIEHNAFTRDGDHLYVSEEIDLVDALTGFDLEMYNVDGTAFTVNVVDITECDHVLRVAGKGMPRRNGRGFGDLYITFEVDFPDKLTQSQKDGIRKILSTGNDEL